MVTGVDPLKGRKALVHASIKAWVDGWGTFGHSDADVVIEKITDIIMDNSAKPEQWGMREEGFHESWMPMEALRELGLRIYLYVIHFVFLQSDFAILVLSATDL
jgi:hypothetical protein